MDSAIPILGALCFVGFCLLLVAGLVVLVFVLAKQLAKKTDRNWQQVADDLGLTYGRDEVTNPFIAGRLHGVEVRVGTKRTIRWVTRSDSSHRKPMIWTRVTAQPVSKPLIEVWLRKNKVPVPEGLTELATGDAEFDARYRLFAPRDCDVDAVCPPAVRNVMLRTTREVQIIDRSVIWSNSFIERNPARLTEALHSAAQVAHAIDEHARRNPEAG